MAESWTRRRIIQVCALGAGVLAFAGIGIFTTWRAPQAAGSASPSPSASAAPQSAVPTGPVAVASPPATPTPSAQLTGPDYEGTDDFDHDQGHDDLVQGDPPGFVATSDRKPAAGDAAAAKAVLESVLAKWGALDTSKAIRPDEWVSSWASMPGSSTSFARQTLLGFSDLWGGVVRFGGSAQVTGVTVEKELWNVGSDSLWRVHVARNIVSNMDGSVLTTDAVTFDFLVHQDDTGSSLSAYAPPEARNEKPDTFYLAPVM